MLSQSLFAFLPFLALTSASPLPGACNGTTTQPTVPAPSTVVTPTLPETGDTTELPPPGDVTLKHIVVGHGVQNYTCTEAGGNATSTGALAVVWEITGMYPGSSSNALSEADWDGLTSKVLRTTDLPINQGSFPAQADLTLEGLTAPLKFLGHHFFDETNSPTFDLSAAQPAELFKGKKDDGVKAPADADKGLTDEGAVDWLKLSDKGTSSGITLVYRVLTAGGNPSTCTEAGAKQSVPYATMYWMYA
ncbi:hypothetical protein F4779DRAFT_89506 [Xylariaceae sp. FL0662B]|nr:hypothetical protein F4779DRAFT_89506 [Xylariaceae sp. FL0662B]